MKYALLLINKANEDLHHVEDEMHAASATQSTILLLFNEKLWKQGILIQEWKHSVHDNTNQKARSGGAY